MPGASRAAAHRQTDGSARYRPAAAATVTGVSDYKHPDIFDRKRQSFFYRVNDRILWLFEVLVLLAIVSGVLFGIGWLIASALNIGGA